MHSGFTEWKKCTHTFVELFHNPVSDVSVTIIIMCVEEELVLPVKTLTPLNEFRVNLGQGVLMKLKPDFCSRCEV